MTLIERIHSIDIAEPYFWRLHLSKPEFDELGDYVRLHQEDALAVMAYLAEWYKREYCGSDKSPRDKAIDPDSATLQTIWKQSGIDIDTFVYRTESGNHLWLYSIYVLGGLAIRHELARNDNGRFLKRLCRIYHGEDEEDLTVEAERAIAFKESIVQRHSLFHFLKDILNNENTDGDAQVTALIAAIQNANDEELKTKFRLEWLVSNEEASRTFNRKARLWLRPEEVGSGLHQYIRHDRLRVWGITSDENNKELRISLRWFVGKKVVQDADVNRTLILFQNQGEYGYVAVGIDKNATTKEVPTGNISKLEIVAFDDNDNRYIVQTINFEGYFQLWQIEDFESDWSSRTNAQRPTAVLYTGPWCSETGSDLERQMKGDDSLAPTLWKWNYIHTDVTLRNEKGTEITLYNRIGTDQVYLKLYHSIIKYYEGGKVRMFQYDEEEDYNEITLMPVLFSKQDVRVRHFDKTDDEVESAATDKEADIVEYKMKNGRYTEWTDTDWPSYGPVTLRICEKGVAHILKAVLLPGLAVYQPIIRDLTDNTIRYRGLDDDHIYQDNINLDYKPLDETITLKFGDSFNWIEVEVWRPVCITEVYLDHELYCYHEELCMPIVLKQRVDLRVFNEKGYHTYDCRSMPSLYAKIISCVDNKLLSDWKGGNAWPANLLDSNAPDSLSLCIGSENGDVAPESKFFYWDMDSNKEPIEVPMDYDNQSPKDSIMFQDMTSPGKSLQCRYFQQRPHDAFKRRDVSELACYEVAAKYRIYFFAMEPLRRMVKQGKTREKLIEPLRQKRGDAFSSQDLLNLARFADEFQLNLEEII